MHCKQARQLFDAYLDGELSASLATELGAHRLRCADCRQALALLEVSGHILRSDRDPVQASDDFTDRLLACVDSAPTWRKRLLNTIYIGGPIAAAAVIALAFIGVFDGKGPSQVAGVKEVAPASVVQSSHAASAGGKADTPHAVTIDPAEQALGEYIDQTQQRMKDKGESVQRVLDLTILQVLDILEDAKDRSNPAMKPETAPWDAPVNSPTGGQNEHDRADSNQDDDSAGEAVAPEPASDPQSN